jgi:hypothetical protein
MLSSEIKLHFGVKSLLILLKVRKMHTNFGRNKTMSDLKSTIAAQIDAVGPGQVWVPTDFAQLGNRDAIDKTLQRMVQADDLRRIDRGLYDKPTLNRLTKRPTTPDYRAVIEPIARRDQLHLLVDSMTAANNLGLTDAVPARVTIHTDARRRAIQLDKPTIDFKQTAPSRLYWAGHPAMRVVQALYWLKDTLASDRDRILGRLTQVLADPVHGTAIRQEPLDGFSALPAWMQSLVRELPGCDRQNAVAKTLQPRSGVKPPATGAVPLLKSAITRNCRFMELGARRQGDATTNSRSQLTQIACGPRYDEAGY